MHKLDLYSKPHRRYNPLTGDWVMVSPHRAERPWQGQQEAAPVENRPQYDPDCYLCPGNTRVGGHHNPQYEDTFVFTNDFAALMPGDSINSSNEDSLFKANPVTGTCRVFCFSPRHDLTLAEMPTTDIIKVVNLWADQTADLGKSNCWVQIFENRGEVMGSSNPHPHGQVWASDSLPNEPFKENKHQYAYFSKHKSVLLLDYLAQELKQKERIVVENEHWVVLVPYWAVWPFETILIPKRHVLQIPDLSLEEREGLAEILKNILVRYDNLFKVSFPYTMGWHGAPFDGNHNDHWQLHAHFYPPLLRSATVKKFMVGYEMLSESQRDITAEQAADRLQQLPEIHFKDRN